MKKLLLTLLFILALPIAILAQTVTDDQNINYGNFNSSSKTCTVVESSEVSGDIVIRSTVEYNGTTYTVTSIDQYAFFGCKNLTSVIIPDEVTSIGKTSFTQCSNLISVKIPDNVTSIAVSVFEDCPKLSSVNIPENVTSIGTRSFYNCSSLSSISIPDKVKNIGDQAFAGCSGITSIKIPEGIKTIKNSTFFNCKSLTSVELPNSLTSIENDAFYSCAFVSIEIPTSVTSIGSSAFGSCEKLTTISIPDGIKEIGAQTFYDCSSLESVNIPEGVTSIGEQAFRSCYKLTSIVIPNTVTSIGERAFSTCFRLTSIEIPNSVNSIGGSAFYGCSSLKSVNIPEGVTSIGEYTFYSCTDLKTITIPESVTSIGDKAFLQCLSVTDLTIGSGVETIGDNAFGSCDKIASITYNGETIPAYLGTCFLTKVYESATLSLPKVDVIEAQESQVLKPFNNIEASGTTIKKDGTILCTSIDLLPNEIVNKELGKEVELGMIVQPGGIYPRILWESDNENVAVFVDGGRVLIRGYGQATLTATAEDGSGVKGYCLVSIERPCTFVYDKVLYQINEDQRTCVVANNLNNDELPYNADIVIPEKALHLDGKEYPVTGFSVGAFYQCAISTVDIKAPIEEINISSFYRCSELTKITMPSTIKSIERDAFHDCTSLTSIEIPASVTSIGNNAFEGSNLSSIDIPDNVQTIGKQAFSNCSELRSVTIGTGVETIEGDAFEGSNSIETIIYNGETIPAVLGTCFPAAVYESATLSLPKVSVEDAQASEVLNPFYNVEATEEVIKENGNILCKGLTISPSHEKIVYGEPVEFIPTFKPANTTVKSLKWESTNPSIARVDSHPEEADAMVSIMGIGEVTITATTMDGTDITAGYTFTVPKPMEFTYLTAGYPIKYVVIDEESKTCRVANNSNKADLKNVIIPEQVPHYDGVMYTVVGISDDAFNFCPSLTSVELPATVTTIGDNAFSSCHNLTSINIPEGVTSIGAEAFNGCTELSSIKIPEGVTSIGNRTFKGCTNLSSVTLPEDLISIGESAFRDCPSLTEITFGKDLNSISDYAFYGCPRIKSITFEGTKPIDFLRDCFDPEIYEYATLYTPNMTDSDLNGSDTQLGKFENQRVKPSVIVLSGKDRTAVPGESFTLKADVRPSNSIDLKVTWESSDESVATVDENGKVTAVAVGDAVITATSASYSDISAPCTVTVSNLFTAGDIIYEILDNNLRTCRVAENRENENLPAEIVIPATVSPYEGAEYTVTEIAHDAFSECTELTSVVIPESVTNIGDNGFWGCSELKTINLPGSVTSIGEGAFYECRGLESIEIPNAVTSIESMTFGNCFSLSSIKIPDKVTSIGDNAFESCKLTKIEIPNSVTSIGSEAFIFCRNLSEITFGSGLESIGESAFADISDLKSINFNGTNAVEFPDNCFDQSVYTSANFTAPNLTSDKFEASSWTYFKNTAIKLSAIALSQESWEGFVGASVELSATPVPDNAIQTKIVWSTSDPEIATVDESGKVTAVALGEAVITATAAGNAEIKTVCAVKVIPTPVTSISLDKESLELIVKQSATLSANILPEDATDKTVTWSTSDETIATVDAEGKITAVSVGEVTVTAVANGGTDVSASCKVKVLPILVSAITLNETEVSLRVNGSVTLTAEVSPADATNSAITWSTSDAKIATVDESGKVTAVALGTAVITATAADGSGVKAECTIKVIPTPVSGITLSETEVSLRVNGSVTLTATLPEDATNKAVVWSTSDEEIATVDENGKVTAVALGTAVITATAADGSGVKAECTIKVVPTPVGSISLNKESLELTVKQSATLSATILPEDATDKTVTWSTSDAKIATVDADGKITAVSVGEVTVTAVANGATDISASCKVKVLPILVSAITLNETEVSLRVNGSVTLTAEISPADATDNSITWSTSDETIATVDENGKVTAVALGEAVITATAADGSGVKAECTIKVVPTPVSSITLNETEVSLRSGDSVTLTATVNTDATNSAITWSTSDAKIATVDENGKVTAVALGTAVITATAADGSGVTEVCYIEVLPPLAESITLNVEEYSAKVGERFTLIATVTPEEAADQPLIWESSDPEIATVTSAGVVEVLAPGEVTITVTTTDGSDLSASCLVYLSSGIRAVFAETNYRADIYNIGGVLIRRDATLDDFNALAPGIYIVNRRKVLKK